MSEAWYFDCPNCGHIGPMSKMKDHPTRPMPTDLGFCPVCAGEIEELITEGQVRVLLMEYGDDPDVVLAEINAKDPTA